MEWHPIKSRIGCCRHCAFSNRWSVFLVSPSLLWLLGDHNRLSLPLLRSLATV